MFKFLIDVVSYLKKHYYLSILFMEILVVIMFPIAKYILKIDVELYIFILLGTPLFLILLYYLSMKVATMKFDIYKLSVMKYEKDTGFTKFARERNMKSSKWIIIVVWILFFINIIDFNFYIVFYGFKFTSNIWCFGYILLFLIFLFFYAMSVWGAAEACIKAYKEPIPEKYKR